MAKKTGVAAALAEDPPASVPASESDQAALFDKIADAEAAEIAAPDGLQLAARGPGRPPGARNVSTEQTKRVIRANGGDPHLAAGRVVAMGPLGVLEWGAALAERSGKAGLSVREAFAIWQRSAEFLGPYLMPKEAQRVEIEHDGTPVTIVLPGAVTVAPDIIGGRSTQREGFTLADDEKSIAYEGESGEGHTAEGSQE